MNVGFDVRERRWIPDPRLICTEPKWTPWVSGFGLCLEPQLSLRFHLSKSSSLAWTQDGRTFQCVRSVLPQKALYKTNVAGPGFSRISHAWRDVFSKARYQIRWPTFNVRRIPARPELCSRVLVCLCLSVCSFYPTQSNPLRLAAATTPHTRTTNWTPTSFSEPRAPNPELRSMKPQQRWVLGVRFLSNI